MRTSSALLILMLAMVGCAGGDDDVPIGAAPIACDIVVDRAEDCPAPSSLCTPDSCGAHDCCYVENGEWQDEATDCFEGCSGNVDAPTDAPPSDGCGAFDGAIAHC